MQNTLLTAATIAQTKALPQYLPFPKLSKYLFTIRRLRWLQQGFRLQFLLKPRLDSLKTSAAIL